MEIMNREDCTIFGTQQALGYYSTYKVIISIVKYNTGKPFSIALPFTAFTDTAFLY